MEKFTLRKVGKKLLPVAFGLGVVTVAGNINSAQAEEITSQPSTTKAETTVKEEKQLKPQVTKAQVAEAKVDLQEKTIAQTKQANEVNKLVKEETANKTAINNTKEQITELETIKKEATPAKVVEAKDVIENTKQKEVSKKSEVEKKTQEITKLENKKSEQQARETFAKEVENKAVKSLEQAVAVQKQEEAILSGTGQDKVIAELEQAKTNKTQAETTLLNATKKLEEAKQADSTKEETLKTVQSELEKATTSKEQAQANVDSKQTETNKTQAEVKDLQNQITKLESQKTNKNTIKLSAEYIENLKKYTDKASTSADMEAAVKKLAEINNEEKANNKYIENSTDDNSTLYNLNDLPENIRTDLSLFASELVNQIRVQMGTPLTEVTSSSVEFAKKVRSVYIRDKFDMWKELGHHTKGLEEVEREYDVESTENWSGTSRITEKATYKQLKRHVYDSIINFMIGGGEWLHAQSVAGLNWGNPDEEYLGMDFAKVGEYGGFHLQTISKPSVAKSNKNNFNTTVIQNPYDTSKATQQIQELTKSKTQKESTLRVQQAELAKSADELTSAKKVLTQAETNYNNLTAQGLKTPNAEKELKQAQTNLDLAKTRLINAEENYAKLTADVKEKEANLEKAKAEVSSKQSALVKAQTETKLASAEVVKTSEQIEKAKAELVELEKEIANLQSAIKGQEEYLNKLENASVLLEQTKIKLVQEEIQLVQIQEKLKEERAKLEVLKEQKNLSQANYDKLVKELALQEKLDVLANESVKVRKSTSAKSKKETNVLPKTSASQENSSSLPLGLAAALAGAGLLATRKKQK